MGELLNVFFLAVRGCTANVLWWWEVGLQMFSLVASRWTANVSLVVNSRTVYIFFDDSWWTAKYFFFVASRWTAKSLPSSRWVAKYFSSELMHFTSMRKPSMKVNQFNHCVVTGTTSGISSFCWCLLFDWHKSWRTPLQCLFSWIIIDTRISHKNGWSVHPARKEGGRGWVRVRVRDREKEYIYTYIY